MLIKCRECGAEVSSAAPTCPRCGIPSPAPYIAPERQPANTGARIIIGSIIGVLILILVFGLATKAPSPGRPHERTLSEMQAGPNFTRLGFPACTRQSAIDRVIELLDQSDTPAVVRYVMDESNDCILWKADLPVVVEDSKFMGPVRVRVPGSPTSMWTPRAALSETTTTKTKRR